MHANTRVARMTMQYAVRRRERLTHTHLRGCMPGRRACGGKEDLRRTGTWIVLAKNSQKACSSSPEASCIVYVIVLLR